MIHNLTIWRGSGHVRRFSSVVPFKLADIGEGIHEVELLQWFVHEGDNIKSFDKLCEVQSDKATVEITSRFDGTIKKLHHSIGGMVKVGSPLVDIQKEDSVQPKLANEEYLNLSIPHASGENKVSSNSMFVNRDDSASSTFATPAVRKIAKENNINLATIVPTGPKGRVLKEDVLSFLQREKWGENKHKVYSKSTSVPLKRNNNRPITEAVKYATNAVKDIENVIASETVPIKGIQKQMLKSMSLSREVQHLTLNEELVVDKLIRLRKDLKTHAESIGVKLSYMPFFIKALSLALKRFPLLNASISSDGNHMIYYRDHNIGIAVDSPKGLVVPVIKSCQNMSIFDIARELNRLQYLSAEGRLTENDISGATFSLSNIGSIAGTYAVPVIVPPQVAIGAVGRFQVQPRYTLNGDIASSDAIYSDAPGLQVSPVTIANISWSADHRVIDGATVARFSNEWTAYLSNPARMLGETR